MDFLSSAAFLVLPTSAMLLRFISGAGANLLLARAALRRSSVNSSGAVTGFILGLMIWTGGGPSAWLLLLLFFVSSSLLSRLGLSRKRALEPMHEKGHVRDGMQAFANAGPAAVAMVLYGATGQGIFAAAFVAAMACANGDTWASELGVLFRGKPVSILGFRKVEPGTSGGISLPGSLGALAGGLFIGLGALFAAPALAAAGPGSSAVSADGGSSSLAAAAFAAGTASAAAWMMTALAPVLLAGAAGLTGSMIDSLLGAGLQAAYIDEEGRYTEQSHRGALQHRRVRGLAWMNNDTVNLLSNLLTSVLGGAAALFLL